MQVDRGGQIADLGTHDLQWAEDKVLSLESALTSFLTPPNGFQSILCSLGCDPRQPPYSASSSQDALAQTGYSRFNIY